MTTRPLRISVYSYAVFGIELFSAIPKGAYRPPHLRGTVTPSIFKREDEAGPMQESVSGGSTAAADALSKHTVKNKKKREAKKRTKDDEIDSEEEGGGINKQREHLQLQLVADNNFRHA